MIREKFVNEIVAYFKGDQWQKFMKMLTQKDDPMLHLHIYVENSLHPDSLGPLITGYHKLKGVGLDRNIQFSGLPDVGLTMNTQPVETVTGRFLANYELFWFYNPKVLIGPAVLRPDIDLNKTPLYKELQTGNLYGWGNKFMDDYYKQFDFKCVGPNEEMEIRRYFKSDHFKKWLKFIKDPGFAEHVHCNVEINFEPWILKLYAEEAFRDVGIKVDWVVPNVFRVPSGYRGKLIFLLAHPEAQTDIAWDFNPNVVIRPATKPFVGVRVAPDGDFTFDFNLHRDLEAVLASGNYVKLTNEEINAVLSRV